MTRRDIRRRLAAVTLAQANAREAVRLANARVVEATSALPPTHVDPSRRFRPGQLEAIRALVVAAQAASDRLATATADVVNLRGIA